MAGQALIVFLMVSCGLIVAAEFPVPAGVNLAEFRKRVSASETKTLT